ncbi:MAG: RsmB/NOP family class I SAM-dependent RNA methyltransferase [Planctomycetota bacterium]
MSSVSPARRAAWDVLSAYLLAGPEKGQLGSRQRPFPPGALRARDKARAQELAEGSVKRLGSLGALLSLLAGRRRPRPAGLHAALLLGLYQLFFDKRTPARAAVHESVSLARIAAGDGGAGFVNALLRRAAEKPELTSWLPEPAPGASVSELAAYYSHPEALVARWISEHGEGQARRLLSIDNEEPHLGLRVNLGRSSPEELMERLGREDIAVQPGLHPAALILERGAVLETESFKQGRFSIQDPAQLEAVDLLELAPGLRVLDLCAAPGGKSTAIAEAIHDRGEVFAFDEDASRLSRLSKELERLGLASVRILTSGQELEELAPVDRVLVDAPCTNTGVLARRAEARWRFRPSRMQRCLRIQARLIAQGSRFLRSGGLLVYSTCSIEPEENELLARQAAETTGLRLVSVERLLPETGLRDGAGVAVFKKP